MTICRRQSPQIKSKDYGNSSIRIREWGRRTMLITGDKQWLGSEQQRPEPRLTVLQATSKQFYTKISSSVRGLIKSMRKVRRCFRGFLHTFPLRLTWLYDQGLLICSNHFWCLLEIQKSMFISGDIPMVGKFGTNGV